MSLKGLSDNLSILREKLPVDSILNKLRSDGLINKYEEERIIAQICDTDKVDMLIMDIIVGKERKNGYESIINALKEKNERLIRMLEKGSCIGNQAEKMQESQFEVDVRYQDIFSYARQRLITDTICLITPITILQILRENNVIDGDEQQIITAKDTTAAQARQLIDFLWKRGSYFAYEKFCRSLESQQNDRAIQVLNECKKMADEKFP